MRALVIGSTGFLGTHVRQRLAAAAVEVITATRAALPDSAAQVRLDLAQDSASRITGLLAEVAPDAVVNCAGAVGGDPATLAAVNVTGPARLVEAMLKAGCRGRLIQLGSAAEYGRVEPGAPISEQSPNRPVDVYGVTKLAGTRLLGLARAVGVDTVVLRVFNPIGPGCPPTGLAGRLAAELVRVLADGGEPRLGPLDATRDFVDARDVAEAVVAAVTTAALAHPVLNVGSGRATPVRTLVDELLAIAGYSGSVRENAAGSPHSADVPWQQAELSTISEALGWQPRIPLTTSLTDLWKAVS